MVWAERANLSGIGAYSDKMCLFCSNQRGQREIAKAERALMHCEELLALVT